MTLKIEGGRDGERSTVRLMDPGGRNLSERSRTSWSHAVRAPIIRSKFRGPRWHRVIEGAGHNLPEEAPSDFADVAWELASATCS